MNGSVPTPPEDTAGPVIDWLLGDGRRTDHQMRDFADALSHRIVDAGIPLARVFAGLLTLHPLVAAVGYIWRDDRDEVELVTTRWDNARSREFLDNPAYVVGATRTAIRQRLDVPEDGFTYDIFSRLKSEGMTDYLALPMVFSEGNANPITFQTRAPGGFKDEDVAALERITRVLSLVIEIEHRHRVARNVLETYVGKRSGQRVLSGAIRRGEGEDIEAAIWFCDLRGFSALTAALPRNEVITHLNDYFGIMGQAVEAEGGEILKFIGDAMLAIFPFSTGDDAKPACRAALRAADAASAAIDAENDRRDGTAQRQIRCGIALHVGELTYGNIGAAARLDFTVIGPAVNLAARLQELGSELDERVLLTATFAETAETPVADLGLHALRGLPGRERVLIPAKTPSAAQADS